MIGYFACEEDIIIVKATSNTQSLQCDFKTVRYEAKSVMDKLFNAARRKLHGSSNSLKSSSRDFSSEHPENSELHSSPSTRTRQTTVSSLQLGVGKSNTFERPESDQEIYNLYVLAMQKLGVDVESVPALKSKSTNEMWQIVCTAGQQERDDKNTPEYFANQLAHEGRNAHLNVNFLKSLRIELSSKPLSWNDDFARFGGWDAILEAFRKLKSVSQLDVKLPVLRELMKIFRAFTNNSFGLEFAFGEANRAKAGLSAIIDVFSVPCMQCRLGALESILMAALIDDSRLVPLIIEVFRERKCFPIFSQILTESFNSIRSAKDVDLFSFLLDSMLLINCLITYGYEIKDIDFRMQLRSEIFSTDLRKAFNRYKIIDNDRLTVHCLAYLNKAQCDADEFMGQFSRTEADLRTPLNLMQTVAEVLEDDPVSQDALIGLLTKMLCMCKTSPNNLKYISAVDALIEEVVTTSKGYAINMEDINFKGKEDKILMLTLQRGKERLEDDLSHAIKRLENLSKVQTELEAHLESKSQRIQELMREKKVTHEDFEKSLKEAEEAIQNLKNDLQNKDDELKKVQEFNANAQMQNLNIHSPIEQSDRVIVVELASIPPAPPMMLSSNCLPPPPPPMIGSINCSQPPPPPPMMKSGPPPSPPMMGSMNFPPPPPPPMMNLGSCPPPPPMINPGACPPPPPMGLFAKTTTAAIPIRNRPKPTGKTRQLQWEKLNQIKGTIWEGVDETEWEKVIEYTNLEEAFKYDPQSLKPVSPDERRISISTSGSAALIDPKKARNMQIILGRLKLSPNELRTSLLRMDESIWTDSIAHEIIKYLPNKSEQEEISKYFEDSVALDAPKVTAERMAFELSKIVGLEERLKSIELKSLIGDWHVDALEQLGALLSALAELKNKNSLKDFLGLVLTVGNFLNTGTYKANASGFKIDSLLKIRDMKTTEGKSNLLVYLLEFISRAKPDLLSLPLDIKNSSIASKISLDGMNELMAEKKKTVARLEKLSKDYKAGHYEDLNGGIDKYLGIIDPFLESAKEHIKSVEGKLNEANEEFTSILSYFGDDGNFKTPQDLFSIFSDFSSDFERIKLELNSAALDDTTDMKKKISGVFKSQEKDGRNIIDNVLGAARKAC